MLNRQLSLSKKCSPAPAPVPADLKIDRRKKKKKKHSPRSPLQDINGITRSNSISSSSSSMSIEAPRGCLRFFLSNSSSSSKTPLHRPKTLSKTPKSAPNARPSNPSSPRSKPSNENIPKPTSQKKLPNKPKKNPTCLYQWQSGKKTSSRTVQKPKPSPHLGTSGNAASNSASGSEEFCQNQKRLQQQKQSVVRMVDEAGEPIQLLQLPDLNTGVVENTTPVGKFACGSALDCTIDDKTVEEDSTTAATTTTTPPVQASVSPEIQCGSSILASAAATPACYGAGHVVSGVTDRRKCRPRGILTVGDSNLRCGKANVFDNDDDDNGNVVEILDKARASLVPLPADASMRWLLSPCDEEEYQKSDSANGSYQRQKLLGSTTPHSSPSSGNGFPSNVCKNADYTSTASRRRSKITLLSPSELPEFQGFLGPSSHQVAGCSSSPSPPVTPSCKAVISREGRKYRYNLAGENTPFSIDSLGSGNVIQTPQSDSSSDRHVGLSWLNADDNQKHYFDSELDMVEEVLRRASLSPKGQISLWDPPGLSFPFTDLTSPSNSIDFSKLQKTWDNHASCISNSTSENVSQSQIRISWRDGLMSRIFEMDELDCCRCLSDDENDANGCRNDQLKSHPSDDLNVDVGNDQIFNNDFGSPEFVGHEPKIDGKGKEKSPLHRPNPCAESICTDGGGLVASGDSDWNLCYKNQLFEL